MSINNSKLWILAIIVISAIGIGLYAFGPYNRSESVPPSPPDTQLPLQPTTNPTAGIQVDATNVVNTKAPLDNSDASLDKDMSTIDASVNGIENDITNVDKGFNDQPVSQTE